LTASRRLPAISTWGDNARNHNKTRHVWIIARHSPTGKRVGIPGKEPVTVGLILRPKLRSREDFSWSQEWDIAGSRMRPGTRDRPGDCRLVFTKTSPTKIQAHQRNSHVQNRAAHTARRGENAERRVQRLPSPSRATIRLVPVLVRW
jgi:hypothetical protein